MNREAHLSRLSVAVGFVVWFSVVACSKDTSNSHPSAVSAVSDKEPKSSMSVNRGVLSSTTMLSTVTDLAAKDALDGSPIVFSERGHGVAFAARKNGNVQIVFNGKAGKSYPVISHLRVSPDGRHVAHDMLVDGKRCMVHDGIEGAPYDDVWEPVFSPDSQHLAYVAQVGDKRHIVVDNKVGEPFPAFSYNPVFNADSSKIAYVESAYENRKARLVVSDLALAIKSTKEVRDENLVINPQQTRIAGIRISNNKQQVIEFGFDQPDTVAQGALYDAVDKLAFGSDGRSLSYIAKEGGKSFVLLNDRKEQLPDGEMVERPVVRPDNKGVGLILISKEGKYYFYQAFLDQRVPAKAYTEAAQLAYNSDGTKYAYCAKDGKNIFIVANGKEGPLFDMVISPMFSPDGKKLVYRARKDGLRFVVVADADGTIIRTHPGYEMVFDTVFTADGKSVAYGVKDGDKLVWKVETL